MRRRQGSWLDYTSPMKTFKPYNPDPLFLVPPALRDWLPEGHLALFISDVVDALDLAPIFAVYEAKAREPNDWGPPGPNLRMRPLRALFPPRAFELLHAPPRPPVGLGGSAGSAGA